MSVWAVPALLGPRQRGARFCRHCGSGWSQNLSPGQTQVALPSMSGRPRAGRRLGAERVTVLECGRCAGFWMGRKPS